MSCKIKVVLFSLSYFYKYIFFLMKCVFQGFGEQRSLNYLPHIYYKMLSLSNVFSQKNMNLVVGLLTMLIVLWTVMFAVPSLFVHLFDTFLGNMILLVFVVLAFMFNANLGLGIAIVFMVLYRYGRMSVNAFVY